MEINIDDVIKTFLKVDSPKVQDKPYYKINNENNTITLFDQIYKESSGKSSEFVEDKIFTEKNENSYIYEEICRDTINESLKGISFSFISYGDSTSEKLELLVGDIEKIKTNINSHGLIIRLIDNLLKKSAENDNKNYSMGFSFFLLHDSDLVDLSNFYKKNLTNINITKFFEKKFTVKNEVSIINLIQKIKIKELNEVILFFSQLFSLLKKLEKESDNHLYSRSHICIVIYIYNQSLKKEVTISFILLNGSENLYAGKTQKLKVETKTESDKKLDNKSIIDFTKYTLETHYTYETIISCIKYVIYSSYNINNYISEEDSLLDSESNIKVTIDQDLSHRLSKLTTVLYNICFNSDSAKIKYRIIGTVTPDIGFYQSFKDTLIFLFDCAKIKDNIKPKHNHSNNFSINDINYNNNIEEKKESNSISKNDNTKKKDNQYFKLDNPKDDLIFELKNKIKNYKKKIDDLKNVIKKREEKIKLLEENYSIQMSTLKKRLNFPGDLNILISGAEHTKESEFIESIKNAEERRICDKGNIRILEKKLDLANEEIKKYKNEAYLKKTDEEMINYYLSIQQTKDNKTRDQRTINELLAENQNLKIEIEKKNKLNEKYKNEVCKISKFFFDLPKTFKDSLFIINKEENENEKIENKKNQETATKSEKDNNIKNNKENVIKEDSIEITDNMYQELFRKMKEKQEKEIKLLSQKYENLKVEKSDQINDLNNFIKKIESEQKIEITLYEKELIKLDQLLMNIISNYKRIYFSTLTQKCSVFNLKEKKAEFDNILLSFESEISQYNFPLLFKSLEIYGKLSINNTNSILNMKKAESLNKKNSKENLNKEGSKEENLIEDIVSPPPEQMKEFFNEETNEGKIIYNKEKLESMSKESIILHCLNLNKKVNEMLDYLEKYTKYKRGFNVEEFEQGEKYKDNLINELKAKIDKLNNTLGRELNKNLTITSRIHNKEKELEILQKKSYIYNNVLKYRNNSINNFISPNNSSSSILDYNSAKCLNEIDNNMKLKKSNSCINMKDNTFSPKINSAYKFPIQINEKNKIIKQKYSKCSLPITSNRVINKKVGTLLNRNDKKMTRRPFSSMRSKASRSMGE